MSFSNALIPWDPDANTAVATIPENARPEGGRWALILNALLSPSPGRTLDRVYTSIGKVMETQANRTAHTLGLGPHVIAGKIKSYFGDGEERVRQLELLRTIIPTKLEKKCLKLMKYTLPTEAANTQSQAFKEIVDLVTIYPGLRVLFVQTKPLASATSLDAISALWDRSTGAPDKEWIFWRSLTATCLTDSLISAVLEKSLVTDLGKCHDEGLGVIERLLIEHCCASSEYSSALCVRYLAGVLDLPRFWLTMGTVHAHVTDKLCHRLGQVLNDIGVDIPALGPRDDSETPFDYDGLDILTVTLLHGISSWFTKIQQKDWSVQPWYESFAKVLRLLRAPRGADLLPHSHNYASNAFDTIVPTTYHGSELHVMVDGENTTSKGQPSHEDKILTDFKSENMSTLSLHSDTSNQDHTPSVE
ncbi:hypothetical protein K438DRAFT_443152 [Mycena galopus ATCC 62051]|nr:hypothetical protein K438DRAFT_443152 [Mycena galopus ATCC 62051]